MVRADPSLLGESKHPPAEFGKKCDAAFYISSANWSLLFFNFFLGFSVNASSERLNMGEIETLEDF